MVDLGLLLKKAQSSSWELKKLNFILPRGIPFNKPHGFKIEKISDHGLTISVPYKRKNLNHLKGIHACAIATLSELTSGLSLLNHLSTKQYRLIMRSLNVDYHYQAKTSVVAKGEVSPLKIDEEILKPLSKEGVVFYKGIIKTYDEANNHIATATVEWQIKDWKQVKTKV